MLRGERVLLRPATEADLPRFAEIISAPEVARWWGAERPAEESAREFLDEDVTAFAVEVNGVVAGVVQYAEVQDPDYRSAGIDISLAPEWHNQGIGADAVRTLARHLFEERKHHRITIDPAAANARAIACYTKVGFKPVGVMRDYEMGHDGTWHDGLLMDLLRDELR